MRYENITALLGRTHKLTAIDLPFIIHSLSFASNAIPWCKQRRHRGRDLHRTRIASMCHK